MANQEIKNNTEYNDISNNNLRKLLISVTVLAIGGIGFFCMAPVVLEASGINTGINVDS